MAKIVVTYGVPAEGFSLLAGHEVVIPPSGAAFSREELLRMLPDADGRWYYLNPVSNGELGTMMTGWQWIANEEGTEFCYYFFPQPGGPMGAMAVQATTPDGFEVNEQGRWCVNGTEQSRR